MAPCSNVRFYYHGYTPGGNQLARLLSEMSIEYTEGNKSVSADVAALIVELDKRVISDQVAEEASLETQPVIHTPVPSVSVQRRVIVQWLTAMNIPMGVPVTLQFVNDIETSGESDKPATWPDRNPDATEARRRGWIL